VLQQKRNLLHRRHLLVQLRVPQDLDFTVTAGMIRVGEIFVGFLTDVIEDGISLLESAANGPHKIRLNGRDRIPEYQLRTQLLPVLVLAWN
jgi:hypothetical protein